MRRKNQTGFTLVEITISAAVLVVMAKFTIDALKSLNDTTTATSTKAHIQTSGEETLLAVVADLNASAVIVGINGAPSYPHLFDDGVTTDANFSNHDHAPATHHAVQGDADYGPTREIVFVRPADADGDEVPDIDPATGRVMFDAREFSYVLVTGADGRNVLERRTDGAAGVPVAYDVERVTFDDAITSGTNLPDKAIRVRIWFRALDERGALQQSMSEATVRLRNG